MIGTHFLSFGNRFLLFFFFFLKVETITEIDGLENLFFEERRPYEHTTWISG